MKELQMSPVVLVKLVLVYLTLMQWRPEEHSSLTCNNRSSVLGEEGCGSYPPALSTSLQASFFCFLCKLLCSTTTSAIIEKIGMEVANLIQCPSTQAATNTLVAKTGPRTGSYSGLYLTLGEDMCLNKRMNKQHSCISQCA